MEIPDRFIVVDDDQVNNMICEFAFRRFSATTEVKTFLNPDEALSFIEKEYTDKTNEVTTVLFLDVNMPVSTGWEFLETFNAFPDFIKQQFTTYILTSSIEHKDVERAALNPLVKDLLSKPLSTQIIEDILK